MLYEVREQFAAFPIEMKISETSWNAMEQLYLRMMVSWNVSQLKDELEVIVQGLEL